MEPSRICIIERGVVVNVALAYSLADVPVLEGQTLEIDTAGASPGWRRVGGTLTPPVQAPAAARRVFSFLDFIALFTPDEQAAIMSSADPGVRLFCLMAAGHGTIDLDGQRTDAGLALLVSKSLLTGSRRTAIKAGQPPA